MITKRPGMLGHDCELNNLDAISAVINDKRRST